MHFYPDIVLLRALRVVTTPVWVPFLTVTTVSRPATLSPYAGCDLPDTRPKRLAVLVAVLVVASLYLVFLGVTGLLLAVTWVVNAALVLLAVTAGLACLAQAACVSVSEGLDAGLDGLRRRAVTPAIVLASVLLSPGRLDPRSAELIASRWAAAIPGGLAGGACLPFAVLFWFFAEHAPLSRSAFD